MFRLFGLLLVGLVLSGLSASPAFADVINCERTSNDTSGWKNREAFESVWPKEFSLPQEEFIEAGVGSEAMLWVKDYGGGWVLTIRLLPNKKALGSLKDTARDVEKPATVRYLCDKDSNQVRRFLAGVHGDKPSVDQTAKMQSAKVYWSGLSVSELCLYEDRESMAREEIRRRGIQSCVREFSNSTLCAFAAEGDEWTNGPTRQKHVQEAKRRGLRCGVSEIKNSQTALSTTTTCVQKSCTTHGSGSGMDNNPCESKDVFGSQPLSNSNVHFRNIQTFKKISFPIINFEDRARSKIIRAIIANDFIEEDNEFQIFLNGGASLKIVNSMKAKNFDFGYKLLRYDCDKDADGLRKELASLRAQQERVNSQEFVSERANTPTSPSQAKQTIIIPTTAISFFHDPSETYVHVGSESESIIWNFNNWQSPSLDKLHKYLQGFGDKLKKVQYAIRVRNHTGKCEEKIGSYVWSDGVAKGYDTTGNGKINVIYLQKPDLAKYAKQFNTGHLNSDTMIDFAVGYNLPHGPSVCNGFYANSSKASFAQVAALVNEETDTSDAVFASSTSTQSNTPTSAELNAAEKEAERLRQELAALKAQQEQQQQTISSDTQIPLITATSRRDSQTNAVISGQVTDNVAVAEVTIDGEPVRLENDGSFTTSFYVPRNGKAVEIIAFDKKGNKATKSLFIERGEVQAATGPVFASLNPSGKRVKANKDALALIVGIADYQRTPAKAAYADKDAQTFYDYAMLKLGIPTGNIKELVNNSASEVDVRLAVKDWIARSTKQGQSDIYVFFAGHGLANQSGEEMYLLPYDGSPRLLEDSAISRERLFADISAANPRSVTVFLDTCYSGTTRGTDMLIASRPIAIRALEQSIPDNFTVMTAAAGDQTAKPLEEAKHGMFSYFLMKGMEGEADADKNNEITAGELHEYVEQNVWQQSSNTQLPQIQGNRDRVLVRFQ